MLTSMVGGLAIFATALGLDSWQRRAATEATNLPAVTAVAPSSSADAIRNYFVVLTTAKPALAAPVAAKPADQLQARLRDLGDELSYASLYNRSLDTRLALAATGFAPDGAGNGAATLTEASAWTSSDYSPISREAALAADAGESRPQTPLAGSVETEAAMPSFAAIPESEILRQLQQTQRALEAVIAQRNALQQTQTAQSEEIADLQQQMASLQEDQANFVASVTERTRDSLEVMEKTVAMTGLNVDTLIAAAANEGQGGPFIPDPDALTDATGAKLKASVAGLDDEVERWEKLQVVLRSVPLSAPLDHYSITSGFGARVDPFNGARARHEGLDFVNALRSDILATAPGTVVFAGWQSGYGRMVEIDHGLGIHTRYTHLDSIDVEVGAIVDYRQVIGKLGNSGRSSGPHVHYEVRFNDRPLDPMGFLKAGRYVFKG